MTNGNLWRPARSRVGAQLGVTLAALVGSAMLLLFLLVHEMSLAIAFARREIRGVDALDRLAHARFAAEEYRLFSSNVAEGARARAELISAIESLQREESSRPLTDRLGLRLNDAVSALKNDPASSDDHRRLAECLDESARLVGDASNLILDPDLDSYYVMDLVLLCFPEDERRFHQLLLSIQNGAAGRAPSSESIKLQVGLLRDGLRAQDRSLLVAERNDRSGELARLVGPAFARRKAAVHAFLDRADRFSDQAEPEAYRNLLTEGWAVQQLTFDLEKRTSSALAAILRNRIARLESRRFGVVTAAGLAVLFAIVVSLSLMFSISETLVSVARRLESLRSGEVTRLERGIVALAEGVRGVALEPDAAPEAPLAAVRDDELGALARSVNRLADQTRVTLRALGTTQEALARAEAALRESEEAMRHQAFHDALTMLPNRPLFVEQLSQALVRAKREKSLLAVIYLDLDNFKVVNDSLGHEVGDSLLSGVATRLVACLGEERLIARIGGDEFLILLDDLATEDEAFSIAERISTVLANPILCGEKGLFTGASIGIAFCRNGEVSAAEMIKDADIAMYRAKTEGKHRYVAFDEAMNEAARQRMEMEADLREALATGLGLRLFFQPIYSLSNETLDEVEALVRWQHPAHGLILPDRFISLAEETGLILPLGDWVLRKACAFANRWDVSVGVNLSLRQLQADGIVERIAAIVKESQVDPRRIKLEVTESMMEDNPAEMTKRLLRLRALGVRIALDDFGAGYSSMSHLRDMPIDTLKIDRSFVKRLGQSVEDEAIVLAMVQLAQALNLTIVCEGIETLPQQDCLQKLHCDFGQGFLYSPPRPASEIVAMLAAARQTIRRAA